MSAADRSDLPEPIASAPRMFGGTLEPAHLPWRWATARPDGRPHTLPVWGVWLDNAFYFSTGSLAARNLTTHFAITAHLESGEEAVIVEGAAELAQGAELLERVSALYDAKRRWERNPDEGADPFYVVRPETVFGWIEDSTGLDRGAAFHGTATRWRFERQE
jgi:hypothetical protein